MDAEEQRPSKRQPGGVDLVCPMFSVTPAMASRAKEHADKLTADKKKKVAQYIVERDEKLKAIGQEDCDKFYMDKLAEVKAIVGEVEQEAVKEAQEILKKIQGTPKAGASGSILESAALKTERSKSPLSAKVTQIPDSPINISPSSSPSTDSDQDNIPLSQKFNLPKPIPKPKSFEPVYPAVLKSIGEMSQRRVDLCNKLPADHPFQPPIIKPLNMIPADTHISTSTHPNKIPIRVNLTLGGTRLAEVVMGSTIQKPTRFGSPSNLFSLEKHLGGEFPDTP